MKLLEFIFLSLSLFSLFGIVSSFGTKLFEIVLFENHKLNHRHEILFYLFFSSIICFFGLKLIAGKHKFFLFLFLISIMIPIVYYIYYKYVKPFNSMDGQVLLVERQNPNEIVSIVTANHPRTYLYVCLLLLFILAIIIFKSWHILLICFGVLFLIGIILNSMLFDSYHLYNVYIRCKLLNDFKQFKQLIDSKSIKVKEKGFLFLDYACAYGQHDPERAIKLLSQYSYANNIIAISKARAYFKISDYNSAYLSILGIPLTDLVKLEADLKMVFMLFVLNKKINKANLLIDEARKNGNILVNQFNLIIKYLDDSSITIDDSIRQEYFELFNKLGSKNENK